MSNNILEPIPASLNDYLLKYNATVLSDTTPAALGGKTNVTWQKDGFGNISACIAAGGASISLETNGVANGSQSLLNLAGANGLSLTDNGTGTVTLGLGAISPSSISTVGAASVGAMAIVNNGPTTFGYQLTGFMGYAGGGMNSFSFNGGSVDLANILGIWGGGSLQTGQNEDLHFNVTNHSGTMGSYLFNAEGTTVASISGTGLITGANLALSSATTATSATAGAATALPIAPLGYVEISVNGTTVKIPYYTV